MQKILYFTAGPNPSGPEQADIAALNALAAAPYEVGVRNGAEPALYQPKPEAADFVCGTIPTSHSDTEDFPVFDIDNPPAPGNLPSTQAVVSNGQELTVGGSTYTFTVVDGQITAIAVA